MGKNKKKVLRKHQDKTMEYARKVREVVYDMVDDRFTPCEIIGILECVKLGVYDTAMHGSSHGDILSELADLLDDEEE